MASSSSVAERQLSCGIHRDCLIGTYTMQLDISRHVPGTSSEPLPVYASITFHEDGTVSGGDTVDFGQLNQLITPWTGAWMKIGPREYAYEFINVVSAPTGNELETLPVERLGASGTLQLLSNGRRFVGTVTVNTYPLSDLSLIAPTLFATGVIKGARLDLFRHTSGYGGRQRYLRED